MRPPTASHSLLPTPNSPLPRRQTFNNETPPEHRRPMTLPELCIRRPVFTTMLILFPLTVGVISYFKMGVDLFPNVDLPIVTITATRPGTSVEEMETGVTKVLEEAVNTISGIDELRSTTKEGISSLNITFVLEKNRDVAQQEVQSKINTI